MIRLRGWCARRPRGAAVPAGPAGLRWASGGPAGRALRVLVDMDGVLADFEGGFLRKFRARFPDQPFIALEDRRGFWVSEQYDRLQPGLSEKAISIWESENFFFDLEPLPGAVEAVKQMANLESTDVFICTSPIKMYKYCPFEKYAWVEKHFGPDFLEQMVLTRDKTVVSADLLIDDRVDITGKWPAAGEGGRAEPPLGARALHGLSQPAHAAAAPRPQVALMGRRLEGRPGQQAAPLSWLSPGPARCPAWPYMHLGASLAQGPGQDTGSQADLRPPVREEPGALFRGDSPPLPQGSPLPGQQPPGLRVT
ncbi:5'(3')-deoxyribonucleotidase, mitochondrial isoform X5 [Balaenoptera acutorostrata]|uniref:5'(3')-deoxyribonucleotidase, mitochondrial isoform X5 n=1 Tax=Balaenoptera acutorostrata TaxID=9767 RepID=A0A452CB73_BALAC|nr:5'(3')-deoxyribonucleotidase, mitochondrial isoform X5 [Balaenoptera acutorostrata]